MGVDILYVKEMFRREQWEEFAWPSRRGDAGTIDLICKYFLKIESDEDQQASGITHPGVKCKFLD